MMDEDEFCRQLDAALRQQYPTQYAAGLVGPIRDAGGRITGFKGIRLNEKGQRHLERWNKLSEEDQRRFAKVRSEQ